MAQKAAMQERAPTQESAVGLIDSMQVVNEVIQRPISADTGNAVNHETELSKRNRSHGKSPVQRYSGISISDRKKQLSGMSPNKDYQGVVLHTYEMRASNQRTKKSNIISGLTPEKTLDMISTADDNLDENKQVTFNLKHVHQEETFCAGDSENQESYQTIDDTNPRYKSDWMKFFFCKVQLLFKLFHPNIVKICQIYMDSKSLKLSPCYCGLSIYERICVRKETFEDQFLINLIRNLFSVLEFIHRKGFIHRNIQPRNICLDNNGKLCLVGFDFCINLQDANTNKLEIDYKSADCSPEYFSPELCQQIVNADDKKFGRKPRYKDVQITNKSDTYAVGQTTCLIFTKKEILQCGYLNTDETAESNEKFILEIAKHPGFVKMFRPDDMPQDWKNVIDHCLEGDASERCDVSDVIVLLREMEKIRAMGNKPVAIEGKLENHVSRKQKLKETIQQKPHTSQSATQPDHNLQNLSNTRQITDHSKQQLNPQDGAEHFTVDQQTVPSSIAQTSHQIICKGLNDKIKNQRADARIPAESLHGEMTNHTLDRPPPESNNIPQATDNVAGSGLEPVYGSDDDIRISLIPTTIYDDD